MKNIILFLFCFVPFISFAQTTKDSIEISTISETNNLYIKSNNFEGVVFVWEEKDTLFWTPSEEDVIKIEAYIEELYKREMLNLVYFSNLTYSDLSKYKRQYIGQYYIESKTKYLWISFFQNGSEIVQNNIWLKKPKFIISEDPVYLSLRFNYSDILNNNYDYH